MTESGIFDFDWRPGTPLTRMELHEIRCHFLVDVNAWWEWFLLASRCFSSGVTTITAVDPTEFIAVENRSHNILKLLFRIQRSFVFDQTGRSAASGAADAARMPSTSSGPEDVERSSPKS